MNEMAITADKVSKLYRLYNDPLDRVRESFHPLRKQYHTPFYALRDISFMVPKGQTWGIVGTNGSGKSTLLKILTGTLTPSSGRVVTRGRVNSLLELGAGFNPDFTGIENIFFAGTIMGFSRKQMSARVDEIADFAGIGDFINQPAKFYSSGMFARLAFAVYSVLDPDIFIIDESLAVGDAAFVQKCMLKFKRLQERGTTILLVSHDATIVKQLCTKALWLNGGTLQAQGDAQDVTEAYLRHIHKIAEVDCGKTEQPMGTCVQARQPEQVPCHETSIANIDGRSGDQSMTILGIGLYDDQKRPRLVLRSSRWALLRVTVKNVMGHLSRPIIVGYLIRNRLGLDLASANSFVFERDMGTLGPGEIATFEISIFIPLLYPEHYSITPSLAYMDKEGFPVISDRIENAVTFKVDSARKCHIQMQFYSKFKRIA